MSKFTDEQIDLMLKNDSLRSPRDLQVSRAYIYENVSNRANRGKRIKMIVFTVLMAGLSIGAPVLEAASQSQSVEAPKVTYEAPGTTITITPLNAAAAETMGGWKSIQGQPNTQPSNQTQQNNQVQSTNQTNSSTNNQDPSGN